MNDPIKVLTELGLSTDSQMRMVLQVKNESPFVNWKKQDFDSASERLCDQPVPSSNRQEAKYIFLYIAQDIIVTEKKGLVADPADVLAHANDKWNRFKVENEIALRLEEDYEPEAGELRKSRSGTKSQIAYQIFCEHVNDEDSRKVIIEKYKTELDMTAGGATTYFHNMRKKYQSNN